MLPVHAAAALLVAFAAVATAPALAGTVEGRIAIPDADRAVHDPPKHNHYVGQVGAAKTAQPAVIDTICGVAWVADLPTDAVPPAAPARMDQIAQRFVPRILTIVAGQTVEFRNSDNVFHNIFSYSPPKKFDLGRYPKGKSRSVKFAKPGNVQVYCDIHSDMRADIIVAPSRHFALIGPSGWFRIEDVPAGTRAVKIWLPVSGERSTTVEVHEKRVARLPNVIP